MILFVFKLILFEKYGFLKFKFVMIVGLGVHDRAPCARRWEGCEGPAADPAPAGQPMLGLAENLSLFLDTFLLTTYNALTASISIQ